MSRKKNGLIRYEAACRALAEAVAVDEVLEIRNVAEAMRAYAHQAKNREPEIQAAELRIRAERRLGQMMAEQKKAGLMAQGTKGQLKGKDSSGRAQKSPPEDTAITLEQTGIDKDLAKRARKYAAVPEDEWEQELEDWRQRVSDENKRVSTNLQKRGESEIRRKRKDCDIPESAIVETRLTCPTCEQPWPEGRPIHG